MKCCGCPTGQACYPSRKDATRVLAIVRAQREKNGSRSAESDKYPCAVCGHWHLTHASRRRRVDQERRRRKYGRKLGGEGGGEAGEVGCGGWTDVDRGCA